MSIWDGDGGTYKPQPSSSGDTRSGCLFVVGMSVAFWVLLGASLWVVLG